MHEEEAQTQEARFLHEAVPCIETPRVCPNDILGPLKETKSWSKFLLVMTDRYSKLTRVKPLSKITAHDVAKAFCETWVFPYGPPVYCLSDNGKQFTSRYFQSICQIQGDHNLFTSAYHPQINGQAKRCNRTITAALRSYIAEQLSDWDQFTDALTYAYNTQVHRATGLSPFDLVLARPPVHLSLENTPTLDEENLSHMQQRTLLQLRLRELMQSANAKLSKSQARYKADFDKHVRQFNQDLAPGHYVYLKRETPIDEERTKLQIPAPGPFRVLRKASHTVTIIDNDGMEDTVSLDRVIRAPHQRQIASFPAPEESEPPADEDVDHPVNDASLTPPDQAQPTAHGSATGPDSEGFVLEKIVSFDPRSRKFRCRWEGWSPDDDTMEPPGHFEFKTVKRFFKSRKKRIPEDIHRYYHGH